MPWCEHPAQNPSAQKRRRHQGGPMAPLNPATGEGGVAGLPRQCRRQALVPGFRGFPWGISLGDFLFWLERNCLNVSARTRLPSGLHSRFVAGSLLILWRLLGRFLGDDSLAEVPWRLARVSRCLGFPV